MGKLVTLIIALLVIVGVIFGGAYFYASSQEENLAIELAVEELISLEHTKSVEITGLTTGTTEVYLPSLLTGSAEASAIPQVVENNEESVVSIDVENEEVTIVYADGTEEVMTLEEYNAENNPLAANTDTWQSFIDNDNYTLEDTTLNGKAVWKYTFQDDAIDQTMVDLVQRSVESEGLPVMEGLTLGFSNVETTFDGDFVVEFFINQEDYNVLLVSYYTEDDLIVNYELSGDALAVLADLAAQNAQAQGATVDPSTLSPAGQFTFKGFRVDSTFDNIELKDGFSAPSNALMLLVGSYIN